MSTFADSIEAAAFDWIVSEYDGWTPQRSSSPLHEQFDLISALSVIQNSSVDHLPISWQPALGLLGQGGTADISQSLVHIRASFAFKRTWPQSTAADALDSRLRALATEVAALRVPLVRSHPNIVDCEGICWEIRENSGEVYPVLVIAKAQLGSLIDFMNTERGWSSPTTQRISFCIDVAKAILALHSSDIVHGDIKPQNILVFDENGSIKAKVADLGYSATSDSASTLLYLPKSPPWNDPKWHHRGVSLLEGKRMDVFSFGMFSFWILFANAFEKGSGSAAIEATQRDLSVSSGITSSFHCLESWKMKGMICEVAHRFVESDETLDCDQKSALKAFFDKALHEDPKCRDTSFEYLFSLDPSICILSESDISPPKPPEIETASSNLSSHIDFSVGKSMHQMSLLDYRVRECIFKAYLKRVSGNAESPGCNICFQRAAFEVSFCYEVGFGTARDENKSNLWLDQSGQSTSKLKEQIELIKANVYDLSYGNGEEGLFKKLLDKGYIATLDINHQYSVERRGQDVEGYYRGEIADMEHTFGEHHIIPLILKQTLASLIKFGGALGEAAKLLDQVYQTAMEILSEPHPFTIKAMNDVAIVYQEMGRWVEAEKIQRKVLEISSEVFGTGHHAVVHSKSNLAFTLSKQSKFVEAADLFTDVMDANISELSERHPESLISMTNLATVYRLQGRLVSAEELGRRAATIVEHVLTEDNISRVKIHTALARTLLERGNYVEAELLLLNSRPKDLETFVLTDIDTLNAISNLSLVYASQGRLEDAERLGRFVKRKCEQIHGETHPDTLTSIANLAYILWRQGRHESISEMENLEQDLLKQMVSIKGPEHLDVMACMANRASTLKRQGNLQEALRVETQVVEMRLRILGENHYDTLKVQANMAVTLWELGQSQSSQTLLLDVIQKSVRTLGPDHPQTLSCQKNLCVMHREQGRLDEAHELATQLHESSVRVLGENHLDTLAVTRELATTLWTMGRLMEAEEIEVGLLEKCATSLGTSHPETLRSKASLASTFVTQQRAEEAARLLLELIAPFESTFGRRDSQTLVVISNLAAAYVGIKRFEEAAALLNEVMEVKVKDLGPHHPSTRRTMENLRNVCYLWGEDNVDKRQ